MVNFFKNLFSSAPFGLYVTDKYVQAALLKNGSKMPKVKAIGQRPLPEGTVKNGEILNEKVLAKEITALLSATKPHKIKGKKCILSFPESQIFEHIFFLPPALKGVEFGNKLKSLIEETIPIPSDELKYSLFSTTVSKTQVVYVATVKKTVLAQYEKVLKDLCKLRSLVFEPEALSLLRNIPVNFDVDKGIIVVDIQVDKFSWFTSWSEDIFDSSHIRKAEPPVLAHEIKKSMESFKKSSRRDVAQIIITGDKKEAATLVEPLKKALGIPVVFADKYKVQAQGSDLTPFKVVIGSALKGVGKDIKTNLDLLD